MKRHSRSLLAFVLAFSMIPLTGCSERIKERQEALAGKGYTIYVITKSSEAYWDSVKNGAMEAGDELGINIEYKAPQWENEAGIETQKTLISDAVSAGANAIVLASIDADALNDALRLATQNGVQILTIDSDVSYSGKKAFVGTQNVTAGAIAARKAAELMEGSGEVAIVAHMQGTPTQIQRTEGFVNELQGSTTTEVETEVVTEPATDESGNVIEGEFVEVTREVESTQTSGYPDIKILDIAWGEGDVEKSKEVAKDLISNHPDLKLIYATNQSGNIGVCQAVEELGVQDRIQVIGFDSYDGAMDKLNSGVLDGVIVQNPYNMGYLGVRYAVKAIEDKTITSLVDTGVTLVTKSNMNDDDVQWVLNN